MISAVNAEEFAAIVFMRESVLNALASHWSRLLPSDADERCRRIAEQLRSEPAEAAAALADLRNDAGSVQLKRECWQVFEVERELADGEPRWRHDREMQARIAADWCRTLLECRSQPPWPWFGLLAEGEGTGALLALWESVLPRLPTVTDGSPAPSAAFLNVLDQLAEVTLPFGDEGLKSVVAAFREHSTSLFLWLS